MSLCHCPQTPMSGNAAGTMVSGGGIQGLKRKSYRP